MIDVGMMKNAGSASFFFYHEVLSEPPRDHARVSFVNRYLRVE
jgi:hypothetical protein